MKKDSKIPYCGNLAGKGRMVVGAKQLRKAVSAGNALQAYLAKDASPAVTAPLEELCRERKTEIIWVATMEELGSCCGIEVGAAAAALVRSNGF